MRTRVLVVDDEEATRQWLRRDLSRRGYDVAVAHDRASALSVARRFAPDWAIIDLRLTRAFTDRSGLDLTDELLGAYPLLRVLIHTGYADAEFEAGRNRRIVAYVRKPAAIDELCAAIEGRPLKPAVRTATLEEVERDYMMRVLIDHGGNLTLAAKALDISRETLRRKLMR